MHRFLCLALLAAGLLRGQVDKPASGPPSVKLSIQSGQAGIITAIAVTADGKNAVVSSFSSGEGGSLTLWDLETNRQVRRFSGLHGPVWSVALHPNGRLLARVLADDSNAYTYDISKSEPVAKLPKGEDYSAFSWGCSGQLTWGTSKGGVFRSDAATRSVHEFRGNTSGVRSIADSPDCRSIVSGADDGSVILWRGVDKPLPLTVQRADKDSIQAVAWSPDGRYFAAGSESGRVRLFRSDGSPAAVFSAKSVIKGLAFSSESRLLLAAPELKKTQVLDVESKQLVAELGDDGQESIAVSGDRAFLGNGAVEIWSISRREKIGDLRGRSSVVTAGAFAPDMRSIATGTMDGHVTVWDLTTGSPDVAFATGKDAAVGAVGFAKDSNSILAASAGMEQFDLDGRRLGAWPEGDFTGADSSVAESRDRNLAIAAPAVGLLSTGAMLPSMLQ